MTMLEQPGEHREIDDLVVEDGITVRDMRDALGMLEGQNMRMAAELEENLGKVDMMIDSVGWHPLYQYGPDGGLTVAQLKQSSRLLRELLVGNPLLKRGSQLRNTYVWGGGASFTATNASGKSVAIPASLNAVLTKPTNVKRWFSNSAREEIERLAFTDGNVFALVDRKTQTAERVPLIQISGDMRDANDPESIWLIRRDLPVPNGGPWKRVWYYTDQFDGTRKRTVETPEGIEQVDTSKTIVHQAFNGQVGWAYGVPDALPVIAWARVYREAMVNGFIMSKAMAQFAYKLTAPNKAAGTRSAAEIARPGQGGRTNVIGADQDFSALGTAGRGYDFASLRPLAAHIAAGLEVSVVALLSDPSAAGSNNGGSSTTLDAPAKATAIMRRRTWDDFHSRLLTALGSNKTITTVWRDLPDDTVMRLMQAWQIGNIANVFDRQVIQTGMADVLGISDPGALPELPPVLQPGDTAGGSPNDPGTTNTPGTSGGGGAKNPGGSAGSGQGKSTGAGSGPNDHSTDGK